MNLVLLIVYVCQVLGAYLIASKLDTFLGIGVIFGCVLWLILMSLVQSVVKFGQIKAEEVGMFAFYNLLIDLAIVAMFLGFGIASIM